MKTDNVHSSCETPNQIMLNNDNSSIFQSMIIFSTFSHTLSSLGAVYPRCVL